MTNAGAAPSRQSSTLWEMGTTNCRNGQMMATASSARQLDGHDP
jgi:hypothetical protein